MRQKKARIEAQETKGDVEAAAAAIQPLLGEKAAKPPAVKDEWTTIRLQAPARSQLEKFRLELMEDDSSLSKELRDILHGGKNAYSLGDVAYVSFVIARRSRIPSDPQKASKDPIEP